MQLTDTELTAIRERDRVAECTNPACHQTSADRRTLLRLVDSLLATPVRGSLVCPYCGMTTWRHNSCALPGCDGYTEANDDENLRTWRESFGD